MPASGSGRVASPQGSSRTRRATFIRFQRTSSRPTPTSSRTLATDLIPAPDGRDNRGHPARRRRLAAGRVATLGLTLAAACGGGSTAPRGSVGGEPPPVTRPSLAPTYRPSGHAAAGDAFVHLFEWRWTDIATECETRLGPAGWKAVQVSPPEEHSITPNHEDRKSTRLN